MKNTMNQNLYHNDGLSEKSYVRLLKCKPQHPFTSLHELAVYSYLTYKDMVTQRPDIIEIANTLHFDPDTVKNDLERLELLNLQHGSKPCQPKIEWVWPKDRY